MTEEQLTYYQRNKERCKQNARDYQAKNKDYYKDYWVAYYQQNKTELLRKRKDYARKQTKQLYEKKKRICKEKPATVQEPIVLQPIIVEESQPPIIIQQGNFTVSFS